MKIDTTQEIGLLDETDKPTKAPWFLRFARAFLAVGLLALPGGEIQAQSNSPTNNSVSTPTPTDHPTGLGDYDNARSKADCLEIWNKKKKTE